MKNFALLIAALLLAVTAPATATAAPAVPKISWKKCGETPALADFQCAQVKVPTDYDNPRAGTTTLALTRLPATDKAKRIGSLFTNPGGPGVPGVSYIHAVGKLAWAPEVRARFDIIGFDPRGVGASSPVSCFATPQEELAAFTDEPVAPMTPKEITTKFADATKLAAACRDRSADRYAHMSTANVARDLDLLRQAVGDEKLSYHGFSYGTYLGATYAKLFPKKVRALVLDGPVDPAAYSGSNGDRRPLALRVGQHLGADEVLDQFSAKCREAACALTKVGDPEQVTERVLAGLKKQPIRNVLPNGTTYDVSYDDAVQVILSALSAPTSWPPLAGLLSIYAKAQAAGTTSVTLTAAQAPGELLAMSPRPEEYTAAAGNLVVCLDTAAAGGLNKLPRLADEADAEAPHFGRNRAWNATVCEPWTTRDRDAYFGPWQQEVSVPVLVVGTRYDSATPYRSVRTAADYFPEGRVLTIDAWGHTSLGKSACATTAIGRYLVSGEVADGTVCAANFGPFDPLPTK
ncbi:alpha/beta hydrolase [Cryptosporangium sp. NPDC048952]|uniref:alpha/beta hydrolase n=1 Tax=Cryptosporangium sp. NPDC048952 TaxID=3363961 RepID=UPI003723D8E6